MDGQKDATGANFTLDEGMFFCLDAAWLNEGPCPVALLSATIGEIEKQTLDLFVGFDPLSKKTTDSKILPEEYCFVRILLEPVVGVRTRTSSFRAGQ